MQLNKKVYVWAAVALVAAVVVWFSFRQRIDAGVTNAKAAIGEASDARANRSKGLHEDTSNGFRAGGDNQHGESALVSAFRKANDCLLYHMARNELGDLLNDPRWSDLSSLSPQRLQSLDASSANNMKVVQRLNAACAHTDPTELAHRATEAAFSAALQGDALASGCFVNWGPKPWGVPRTAGEKEALASRYARYAPEFRRRSLESGDPLLAKASLYDYTSTPLHPSRSAAIPKENPQLVWRSVRLASLRATLAQRTELESQLAVFAGMGVISPAQIAEADAWAKQAYEQRFAGQPPTDTDSASRCFASSEIAPL